jgi:hypothetical protein
MNILTTAIRAGAIGAVVTIGQALVPGSAVAEPPAVDAFDVAFVDATCGEGLDADTHLHVRFTDNVLPDGSLHHWLDLRGTLANDANGRVVTVHAARRFTDATDGSSVFRGLQADFSGPGAGVLAHNSGWSDGVIDRGRWDLAPTDSLPAAVCSYLFG